MSAVYGCHNRKPLKTGAVVQEGWHDTVLSIANLSMTRQPVMVAVPDEMSKDCRYTRTDLGQADAKCEGCKHRAGRLPALSES